MKFSLSVLATLATLALAKPDFTNSDFSGIQQGTPFKITWENAEGPVTITVVTGPASNLVPVAVVTSDGTGGSFVWTPENLPSGTYALKITDSSGQPNFSMMFTYTGTGTLSSSLPSSTAMPSSTVTSSATSVTTATSHKTTTTSTSSSSSKSTSSTSSTTSANTSKPTNTNDSPKYKSPLALVLLSVAALAYFN